MKKEKGIILTLLVIIIILIGGNINFILEKNLIIKNNKKIIKEMSESTQITDLNNQINVLNTEHTEYMNYIQTCKTAIATALTTEGVETSNQATLEKMTENISKILQAKTKDATATAEQILDGQTAWINGTKVTGTMANNGAITKSLNAGGSYTIPAGYHNGNGTITANSLANQTQATATVADIASGKTAYVNGQLITGNANNASIITKIYNYSASLPSDDNRNYSGSNFTVNVKSLYPSTYTSFTNSNFYFITTKAYAFCDNDNPNEYRPGTSLNWSYNSNTGILTVSNLGCSVGGTDDAEVKITEGYVILIT